MKLLTRETNEKTVRSLRPTVRSSVFQFVARNRSVERQAGPGQDGHLAGTGACLGRASRAAVRYRADKFYQARRK